MNKKLIKQFVIEILFVATLIAIDLISKQVVFDLFEQTGKKYIVVLEKIFAFQEAKNYGASFSILSGQTTLLLVITIVATILMGTILVIRPNTGKSFRYAVLLLIGGGIGNVVDRISLGYVRDFIDYTFLKTFFNIDFAIGNIADLFCLVGVLIFIVYIVFEFDEKQFMSKKKLLELELKEKENGDSKNASV